MSKKHFLTLIITMSVTIVALTATLIIFIATTNTYSTQLENIYTRSFYELSTNINDLEVDISKLIATNESQIQQQICEDIYNLCQIANTNISNVPVSNENIEDINRFVNQLGGFVYSLNSKLVGGVSWSQEDIKSINDLHAHSLNLMYEFNNYLNTFTFNYSMLKQVNYNNSDKSNLNGTLDNIQGTNSEVPTLIYDGPFADSVLYPNINGLSDIEVNAEQARAIVMSELSNFYSISELKYVNNTEGLFVTYNFSAKTPNLTLFVQVSKRGGMILEITSLGSGGNSALSAGQCNDLAVSFARSLQFNNVYSVWHTINGDIAYVNLAPIVGGVIYYPDLIKVKIDRKLGTVTGWEARNYAYNHVSRTLSTPTLSMNEAQNKLSPLLTVIERNKALIPLDYGKEVHAYEFICTWKDYTYYVYLDVITGKEVNILRIIKTTSGDLML